MGATINDGQGLGTIINDDSATLSIDDVTQAEGNAGLTTYTFTVSIDGGLTSASAERLRVYRISQAIWASDTERRVYTGGTDAIDPDISFLILPRPSGEATMP